MGGDKMGLFRKKERPRIPFDPETQTPAVRSSICTGELTVGFIDKASGKFHEYQLTRNLDEVEQFCGDLGIPPESIKRIY